MEEHADGRRAGVTIENCKFVGVEWDKAALEVVQTVASALLNLTVLFRSQAVTVETMIKIDGPGATLQGSRFEG